MNPESLTPLTFGILLYHPRLLYADKALKELFSVLGIHEFTQYEQPTEGSAQFTRVWRGSNQKLACMFKSDRVEIVHEFPSVDLAGFWRSASDVLSQSTKILGIPAFVMQQYLIRKTASLLFETDSRTFLGQRVCKLEEKNLQDFGRPIHGIGLRFVFPATPDAPFEFDVKMESLLRNPAQIFLENNAKFLTPVQLPGLEGVEQNLQSADAFLSKNVAAFLSQFNTKPGEPR